MPVRGADVGWPRPCRGRIRGASNTAKNSSARVFDHVAAGTDRRVPEERSHSVDQLAVSVAQAMDQRGGIFDVGHQHGHEAGGELHRRSSLDPTELELRSQLAGDEPDRHDPELLGRVQQPLAGALPGALVFEVDPTETSQRVADVRLVVDRQPPPAARVDVGERAVREFRSLRRIELGHERQRYALARTSAMKPGRLAAYEG